MDLSTVIYMELCSKVFKAGADHWWNYKYVRTSAGIPHENPEGYSCAFLVGVCRPVCQILTLFQTKKCHFSHPFSDLASKKLSHHYLD